ncbi:unnamed protein product [Caenorhabditis bovis]|uniref:C2H2-type domain-containing protein n=1 Tax=Caenorhabditis bovis TaxID=2654633 RepID=A0A8S1EMF0_9PELO|nr:unnamed protein product [Caenorhabditis bovis]
MRRPRREVKVEIEEANEAENAIKSEQFKCELCDASCSSISDLQTHTLSEHVPKMEPPTSPKVCCQQCDATFDSFAQFAVHMRAHLVPQPPRNYYCPMCPLLAFPDSMARVEHIALVHVQVKLIQHICNECDSSFVSASALANHFSQSHLKVQFECTACKYITDDEAKFKDHSKSHYRTESICGCGACGCTFASTKLLIAHVQMCHDNDTSFSILPILGKVKRAAQASPSTKSSKTRVLQCSVCDETVAGEDGLDEHRLLRHCKVRYADKCAECHAKMSTEEEFVEHCALHSKDMTIHCPVCRQSLRSDSQVHAHKIYHMRRDEAEEPEESSPNAYTFVCPICGEKFDEALKLITHGKQHDVDDN